MVDLPGGQIVNNIHIIVPFYNAKEWIQRCLESIEMQQLDHGEFFVHVVDDASTDNSGALARSLCEKFGEKFDYHCNEINQKCPHNIWEAVNRSAAGPSDVMFILDGDDYLPHGRVLQRVAELFAEITTWLTYGQYMSDPPDFACEPASAPQYDTVLNHTYRQEVAVHQFFNHPLIFRRFLFDAIPIEDLKRESGQWFETGYDRIIMIPMLELASPRDKKPYWKFINEVLYVYNSNNDNSEIFVRPLNEVDEVFGRRPLEPLHVTPEQGKAWFGNSLSGE